MSIITPSLRIVFFFFLTYLVNVGLASGHNSSCAAALFNVLGSKVSYPNSTTYTDSLAGYSSIFSSEISPAVVVKPASVEDVATVIKTLKPHFGVKSCKLAIRGEGQQSTPGAANIAGGITLDLSSLTGVQVNHGNSSVSIGAGARWADVYNALVPLELAVNGGRPSYSGIGGLALEGGLSFFSSRRGFISDNVVNFQVVLASGRIVNANAHSNSDLWRALRGGANNFGVVTRFDMETFAQGKFWGGSVTYSASSFPAQIKSLVNFVNGEEYANDAYVQIGLSYFGNTTTGSNMLYYSKLTEEPSILNQFTAIPGIVASGRSVRTDNVSGFADEQSAGAKNQQRWYYMTTTVKLNSTTLQNTADAFSAYLPRVAGVDGLYYALTFQPLPLALLKASGARGGNSLGLVREDGPLAIVQLLAHWQSPGDDNTIISAGRRFINLVNAIAQGQGQASQFRFMNYAYKGQEVIQGYGEEAGWALRATSRKYDPEGFFQTGVPGGFKLW